MGAGRWLAILCAVALGFFGFIKTQVALAQDPAMQKAQSLCIAGNRTALKEAGFHDYEPLCGGFFICILTQFGLSLVQEPAGILVWGFIATLLFPLNVLMYSEAGRAARGPVRWPILTFFLGQLVGINFVFSAFWVPAAILGQGPGTTAKGRTWMAVFTLLPITLVEAGVFTLNTHTHAWTVCAGLLFGPLLPFVGVLLWPFPAPGADKPKDVAISSLSCAYKALMIPAALGYYFVVWKALKTFATVGECLGALWGPKANSSVAFMTVDSGVMCGAILIYLLATCSCKHVLLCIVGSPFIGPAAAYCAVLSCRERERLDLLNKEVHQALLS